MLHRLAERSQKRKEDRENEWLAKKREEEQRRREEELKREREEAEKKAAEERARKEEEYRQVRSVVHVMRGWLRELSHEPVVETKKNNGKL